MHLHLLYNNVHQSPQSNPRFSQESKDLCVVISYMHLYTMSESCCMQEQSPTLIQNLVCHLCMEEIDRERNRDARGENGSIAKQESTLPMLSYGSLQFTFHTHGCPLNIEPSFPCVSTWELLGISPSCPSL